MKKMKNSSKEFFSITDEKYKIFNILMPIVDKIMKFRKIIIQILYN